MNDKILAVSWTNNENSYQEKNYLFNPILHGGGIMARTTINPSAVSKVPGLGLPNFLTLLSQT